MLRFLFVILLCLFFCSSYSKDIPHLEDRIIDLVEQRETFFARQKDLINYKESLLDRIGDGYNKYNTYEELFHLSKSYRYDLAYKYANAAYDLALVLNDSNLICQATGYRISAFTSGGLFSQASNDIKNIATSNVLPSIRRELYYYFVRHYSDRIDYSTGSSHRINNIALVDRYCDSIINLSANKDYFYYYAQANKKLCREDYAEAIDVLKIYYANNSATDHQLSIISFLIGYSYFLLDDKENGYKYMLESVNYDVKNASRENRSYKIMAQYLFEDGDIELADMFINIAFTDAKFYNARFRNFQINELLPVINEYKIEMISRQRNTVYILLSFVTFLGVISLIFAFIARRNSKIIKDSKRIIEKQLEQLSLVNSSLIESNNIKEYFVVDSLYKENEYLKKIDSLFKKIDIKIKNKAYTELNILYKEFNIKRQRENFFTNFDEIFLKLFPNFIDEYNKLFHEADQINIKETLPPEVRIYALMRLGIKDNERISRFLDLSMNTIYTYKTKVKNKTIVPKDEFEQRIYDIKLSDNT